VNIGGPSIERDLGMSAAQLEWIAAGYTLALAVGLITGGRLGDMFGRKRMLLIGLTGFLAASAGCACAWSAESLIGARVVQGLSAALLVPQAFGLIRDIFPPADIGKAFAALGPAIGLSVVLGPAIAGLLIKANLFGTGWRALFLINLPIGTFALVAGIRLLPAGLSAHERVRLDPVGALLMAAGSFLVVFPLVEGRALGWPGWIYGVLACAAPTFAAFAVQQRARTRARRSALIEVSLLRKRSYVSGVMFTLVFFAAVTGFSLTTGFFLQLGLGNSPMTASLYGIAVAVGAFVGSGVGAWAMTAVGRPILHVGLAIMAAASVLLYVSLKGTHHVGALDLVPGMAIFGVGMGMIFVPLFSIIMAEVDDHEVGSASGLLESLQQLGASLGVALLATLFFGVLRLEDGGLPTARAAGRPVHAAQEVLLLNLVLIGLAFAIGWLLPRHARAVHSIQPITEDGEVPAMQAAG
jgi:MFS family permease